MPLHSTSIEIFLFGALKDAAHSDRIAVVLPDGVSTLPLSEMLQLLAQQAPALERYLPHVRVAINCEYSSADQNVQCGDEIALIPPVAGGC